MRTQNTVSVLLAVVALALITAAAASGAGGFAQKRGSAGCVSEKGEGCRHGKGLKRAEEVTVSPDGRHVYVTSAKGTISIFKRAGGGALSQKRSAKVVRGLGYPLTTLVSPDGKNVYVSTKEATQTFDRDSGSGALSLAGSTPVAGAAAISPDGKNLYVVARDSLAVIDRNLNTGALVPKGGPVPVGGDAVTVSPDGKNVYVVDRESSSLAILDRNPATGALTQKPGSAGCVSPKSESCQQARGLVLADQVVVSPDGKNVYVGSYAGNGVGILDRDPATGALSQKPGRTGCVAEYPVHQGCVKAHGFDQPQGLVVSPNGKSVYVASVMAESVPVLDRNPATGALSQKPGAAGCISQSGKAAIFEEEDEQGACQKGRALAAATDVAISPDGKNLYVASPRGTVAVLKVKRG